MIPDLPDEGLTDIQKAALERALRARRQRLAEALRPLLGPEPDPEHVAALRLAALERALSFPERRPDEVGEIVRKLDAAFLPATLPEALADLLQALRRVRFLQGAMQEAALSFYAVLKTDEALRVKGGP